MRTPPSLLPALALSVALLAACGGGDDGGGVASLGDGDGEEAASTETTLSPDEAEEALLDWAECMRGHGLDVPDPQVDEDGGVQIRVGRSAGGDDDEGPDGPVAGQALVPGDRDDLEEAMEDCGEPPRIGGEFSEEDRAEMEERALAFAECMRENGAPDFPDPDFSRDGPGVGPSTREARPEGAGPVLAGPFGVVDLGDPEVEAAFEVCGEELGEMGVPPAAVAGRGG